jgi:hypothetical protein
MIFVGDAADAADDWIAEHISKADVCVTSDIPLASRCLAKGARAIGPTGRAWTPANIGNALAGRELARHLRELGDNRHGPSPLTRPATSRWPMPSGPSRASSARSQPRRWRRGTSRRRTCAPCAR